jgi:GNAT superfamily N-acetyltransferase
MKLGADLHLVLRPYEPRDQEEVLALLRASLGGGPAGDRSPEFFRWKHLENPFGRSYLMVGETAGRIVGLRAFLRWRLRSGADRLPAVRAVDTATHPEFQGRGIFARLTRRAVEDMRREADLVFNTPNEKSLPGYLKMGWEPVGTLRVSVRPRRPRALIRAVRPRQDAGPPPRVEAPPAARVLDEVDGLYRLLEAAEGDDPRLRTEGTQAYLKWRYGRVPHLDYRAVTTATSAGLDAIALFRVRTRRGLWEATVAEVLVPRDDIGAAGRLLGSVVRSANVDVLTARFPSGSAAARAARRAGFLPVPRGVSLVVNRLRPIGAEVLRPNAWALGLGDLELF